MARTLPEGLSRVERVIEPDNIVCPCCCGDMGKIGQDRSERLDVIPVQYQVIVTVRPKYACPTGRRIAFGFVSSHRDKKSSKPDHECDERAEKFFLCTLSRFSDFQTRLPCFDPGIRELSKGSQRMS
jgi:hypothetical protein